MSSSTQLVQRNDRRQVQTRRGGERGGRRATDRGGCLAPPACDGCGAVFTLQWIGANHGFDEYRCRQCRCKVFAVR
jgi:hypothetical protein